MTVAAATVMSVTGTRVRTAPLLLPIHDLPRERGHRLVEVEVTDGAGRLLEPAIEGILGSAPLLEGGGWIGGFHPDDDHVAHRRRLQVPRLVRHADASERLRRLSAPRPLDLFGEAPRLVGLAGQNGKGYCHRRQFPSPSREFIRSTRGRTRWIPAPGARAAIPPCRGASLGDQGPGSRS